MTDETQGEIAAVPAEETATQGQEAATPEVKAEVEENTTDAKTEGEEIQETADDKVVRLERETAGKQKKIDRQTAANRQANERSDKLRQENERLAALIEKQTPDTEPKIDDYETHDEYNNAVISHAEKRGAANAQKEFLDNQQQIQRQQIEQERLSLRRSQEAEYIVDNPMYNAASNEVGTYIGTLDSSDATQDAVISQLYDGNVPSVIDYFGSNNGENLDELGKIARMAPPQAAVAIYKIQQKLLVSPTQKQTKPKPTPVKTARGVSKASRPLDKQSGKELMDWVKGK